MPQGQGVALVDALLVVDPEIEPAAERIVPAKEPADVSCRRTRRDGAILEVTLDRPKANAIDLATSRRLGRPSRPSATIRRLRVAIVKTAGDKFFCAGWDLKAAAGGRRGRRRLRRRRLRRAAGTARPEQAGASQPSTAWRWAAASSWRCPCDLIYAADHASFALPEIRAGTLADAATIKLPKRIPYHVAMDLLLTGRWMDAAEAHRWGLVNEILPTDWLDARVWEVARLLAGGPPLVFAAIKEVARGSRGDGVPGCDEPDHQTPVPHRRRALRLRGQSGRLPRLRREARPGLERTLDRFSWPAADQPDPAGSVSRALHAPRLDRLFQPADLHLRNRGQQQVGIGVEGRR